MLWQLPSPPCSCHAAAGGRCDTCCCRLLEVPHLVLCPTSGSRRVGPPCGRAAAGGVSASCPPRLLLLLLLLLRMLVVLVMVLLLPWGKSCWPMHLVVLLVIYV